MQRSVPDLGNPFLSPEFAIAAGRVRPAARVAVLSDGPLLAGFFPFERHRFGAGCPVAAALTDCQGLVHVPGVEWDARELLRACHISAWQFNHLVDGQDPFAAYRSAIASSPVVDLGEGFDTYLKKLRGRAPRFVKSLARKSRKLAREIGPVRFEVNPADPSALRLLMRWKSAQYRRTGRPDRFARRWVVELVESLADVRDSGFSGMLSVLYVADVPVAVDFNLRFDDTLAAWFTAYDIAYAKHSPGVIQLLRLIEVSASLGIRLIDLGKGAKLYKDEIKSGDIFVGEGVVTGQSPLAAVHRARVASVQRVTRTVRANRYLFQAADWVLKRYGRSRRAVTVMVPGGPAPG